MTPFSETYNSNVEWVLSFFEKEGDELIKSFTIPVTSDSDVRKLLAHDEKESLVGEHSINEYMAEIIFKMIGVECDIKKYDIFLGAVALDP